MGVERVLKYLLVKTWPIRVVAMRLTKKHLRAFLYHHFGDSTTPMLAGAVSVDTFDWQIGIIKRHFTAMRLSEFITSVHEHQLPDHPVLITVDDGYANFYDTAYPVLKKYGIPATLFVPTNYIDNADWFWWDKLKHIMSNAVVEGSHLTFNGSKINIDLSNQKKTIESWNRASSFCHRLSEEHKTEFIEALASRLQVQLPETPVSPYDHMNWEQVLEVAANNVEIGSHTNSHRVLTRLTTEELDKELSNSKKLLEKRLSVTIDSFSYPYGGFDDYDDSIVSKVARTGYIGALLAHDGNFNDQELLKVPRMSVSDDRLDFLWKVYGFKFIINRLYRILAIRADDIEHQPVSH